MSTHDDLIATLLDIATPAFPPLNAECLFAAFQRNRIHEPRLCPSCHDVYTEDGVPCEECASAPQRGDRLSCGCCRGPESDRCCCWIHQDAPRGLLPHKCSLHGGEQS